jgi:hypothetical protein
VRKAILADHRVGGRLALWGGGRWEALTQVAGRAGGTRLAARRGRDRPGMTSPRSGGCSLTKVAARMDALGFYKRPA